eukprot:12109466-Alexandrium_andersonii.AAC.1
MVSFSVTWGPLTLMSPRATWLASISRESHQQPATMRLRGPIGPPGDHGCGSSASCPTEASGNGSDFLGGPSPRAAARFASRWASASAS